MCDNNYVFSPTDSLVDREPDLLRRYPNSDAGKKQILKNSLSDEWPRVLQHRSIHTSYKYGCRGYLLGDRYRNTLKSRNVSNSYNLNFKNPVPPD